ncbi:MAG: CCA tRNA nucleotidyltransferase [SAR202 cluster bacterium]|nr:CCA tRNA nucleotidyltransferase [SAR202 cluster bacterium]
MPPSRKRKAPSSSDLLVPFQQSLSAEAQQVFQTLARHASRHSLPLYLVGGALRDLILRNPTKDLDLVVEGDAISLVSSAAGTLGIKPTIHHAFGTATIKAGSVQIDIATARKETYARPGALPTVSPSTIEDDLRRRDFTLNAMALGLAGPHHGHLLDPHQGMYDLRQRLVRVLHDSSFHDDATRMFRAVRYEQRLDFQIEPQTKALISEALDKNMLSTISADRLRNELELMLAEASPGKMLQRTHDLGLLQALFPPLVRTPPITLIPEKSVPLVFIAALAYRLTANEAEAFIARINMTHPWAVAARQSADLHSIEEKLSRPDLTRRDLWELLEHRPLVCVKAAAAVAENPLAKDRLRQYISLYQRMKPVLTGDDLLALGYAPGPKVGQILRRLQISRLEGKTNTKDDEVKLAKAWLAS